jgi:hypothetical protein
MQTRLAAFMVCPKSGSTPFVPGIRRQQGGVRRCAEFFAADTDAKLFV